MPKGLRIFSLYLYDDKATLTAISLSHLPPTHEQIEHLGDTYSNFHWQQAQNERQKREEDRWRYIELIKVHGVFSRSRNRTNISSPPKWEKLKAY